MSAAPAVVFSVPANLLITGEYAVTMPGGEGLAVGIEPRAYCKVWPTEAAVHATESTPVAEAGLLRARAQDYAERAQDYATPAHAPPAIDCATPTGAVRRCGRVAVCVDQRTRRGGAHDAPPERWPTAPNALLDGIARVYRPPRRARSPHTTVEERSSNPPCAPQTAAQGAQPSAIQHGGPFAAGARIEIDTSAFFDPHNGRKLGLGSSAAAALLMIVALDWLHGTPIDAFRSPGGRARVCRRAVRFYRAARRGRGSGYDIAASLYGGVGIYRAYPTPRWRAMDARMPQKRWNARLVTWNGDAPVDSGAAVAAFETYRATHPAAVEEYLKQTREASRRLARSRSFDAAARNLREAGTASEALGDAIGTPARLTVPAALRATGAAHKASGAGNERGIALVPQHRFPESLVPITIDADGLTVAVDS